MTSTAAIPSTPCNRLAASAYSATVLPQILTTTRAFRARNAGRSSSSQLSIPGFWSPTELIIPEEAPCTRGLGLPAHGSTESDFTTTAPSSDRSKYAANSAPWPAVPDAVITGFGSVTEPICTDVSLMLTVLIPHTRGTPGGASL